MGMDGECHTQAALLPVNRTGTIIKEAGWALEPVWKISKYR
jgi:hypothetical protein